MTVGLIVACMPAFATVVRHHGFPLGAFWTSIGSKISTFPTKISTKSEILMEILPSNESLRFRMSSDSPREEGWMALSRRTYVESISKLELMVRS